MFGQSGAESSSSLFKPAFSFSFFCAETGEEEKPDSESFSFLQKDEMFFALPERGSVLLGLLFLLLLLLVVFHYAACGLHFLSSRFQKMASFVSFSLILFSEPFNLEEKKKKKKEEFCDS